MHLKVHLLLLTKSNIKYFNYSLITLSIHLFTHYFSQVKSNIDTILTFETVYISSELYQSLFLEHS